MASPQSPPQPQISQHFGNSETIGGSQSFAGYVAGSVHFHSDQELLSALPRAEGAAFNSGDLEHERLCLPGTRTKILQLIEQWSAHPQGERIFWLTGMAGTGKSTIARTVARNASEQKQLGASFFFSRGRGDRGNASKFLTSIAYQLALWETNNGSLGRSIRQAIKQYPDIAKRAKRDQWDTLIQEPLSQLNNLLTDRIILLFVIDAMDECEDDRDVQLILKILFGAKSLNNIQLRVFLTSRPSISVDDSFRSVLKSVYQGFILHEMEKHIVQQDLRVFFEYELDDIRKTRRLTNDFPSRSDLEALIQRAGELFIYAATVCLFVRERKRPSPRERLNIVLQNTVSTPSALKHLDNLYIQILQEAMLKSNSTEEDKADFALHFRIIVGSIVNLSSSLSVVSLAKLLSEDLDDIELTLESLRSVLNIPETSDATISLLHPSFRDFLLDQTRCTDSNFLIDATKTHLVLAENCLNLMTTHLKKDICDLKLPGTLIEEIDPSTIRRYIPAELDYACTYWVRHLESSFQTASNTLRHSLLDRIWQFLERKILYWFEVLSLLGKMQQVIIMLLKLLALAESSGKMDLVNLVYDAYRFSLEYRFIIEQAPLQAYYSALIFSPATSILRKLFESQVPSWIKCISRVPEDWGPLLQTLEGHSDGVTSIAFSPNGQTLVSGSFDKTVRVWDATSGSLLQTLEGHNGSVKSVAFSPDGQTLASGSGDRTVRLWDASSGLWMRNFEAHTGSVQSIAFSPDGCTLASGSEDNTVRTWDAASGSLLQTLESHTGSVSSVAFSSDGKTLASGSYDETVCMWDAASGSLLQALEGHTGSVSLVAFSPDGQTLISGSHDGKVHVWDAASRSLLRTLEGPTKSVSSIAFLSGGQTLAVGSDDTTVHVWDAAFGLPLHTLEGHAKFVWVVAFSPDGQTLASGSNDRTIRLWDAVSGSLQMLKDPTGSLQMLGGHTSSVSSVAFSPDGQTLASGSFDRTVRLWDATFGSLLQTLEGHTNSVSSIAFSPDGQTLVSGSFDKTVRVWDAVSGSLLQTLKGHTNWVWSVAFSPDDQTLASGSTDRTVRVWDVVSGSLLQTLEGHTGSVSSVVFSPDGQMLASGSNDRVVRVWDVVSGSLLRTLEGHTDWVSSVAFSLDGQTLMSGSRDRAVRVWNSASGSLLQTLEGHIGGIVSSADFTNEQLDALSIVGRWVTMNQKRLIWLPSNREAYSFLSYSTRMAIGSPSGIITILDMKSEEIDPTLRRVLSRSSSYPR